ncbi:MAG: LolA family protein [Bacteroidia bacterium]
MKKIFAVVLLIACQHIAIGQQDKQAKQILDKLSAKTKSYSSIVTDFSYSLVNKDRKINKVQNWKLWLKGENYRLDMGDQVLICNGKQVWKILKGDKEVEISAPSSGEDALNPRNIFTMYEKGFKNKFIKDTKVGTKDVHLIELYPLNPKSKDYNTIRLYIDKAAMQIVKSEILGNNGNVYTYEIKKFKTNEATDVGLFQFKTSEFPGYEVNDLR